MVSLDLSSDGASQDTAQVQADTQEIAVTIKEMEITSSLADFQIDEQRRVLDTVAQVRKCGLEGILSLPQLVVCGDQSAGKSSVLEALTEIPFPRNDNLCTRFATEIILRRANTNSLTIRLIPDPKRPSDEQASMRAFEESITNFDELPKIMIAAMFVMDIVDNSTSGSKPRAFARDILRIEIEGPSRPQLTLVDIPGLIQTDTKDVTKADVELLGKDIVVRLQASLMQDALKARYDNAFQELERVIEDTRSYPIYYNHYYTDTVYKRRQERNKTSLASCIRKATTHTQLEDCLTNHTSASVDVDQAIATFSQGSDPNMENVSCEEALDCLFAIYKVSKLGRVHA